MSERFNQLSNFLCGEMKMSHIYQPVMLIQLLSNAGQATVSAIAKAILVNDPTQVEYYEEITKRSPGNVLTENRGLTVRDGDTYRLEGFGELSNCEVIKLIKICEEKIDHFLQTRTSDPWSHRRKSSRYIPGSTKYAVLVRAKYRCQLCGISAHEKALEVDHIIPRNFFGGDDISNLQALCYSCNSMKRDTDNTDLRDVAQRYHDRDTTCAYCDPSYESLTTSNILSYSVFDPSPVSTGHTLIIPRRHVADYFDLFQPELNSIQQNLNERRSSLLESDDSITGFNVGFDSGKDAGQTDLHCYLHLIPRRKVDSESVEGGLRSVISRE
ncbi:MAG: HIT domain-containing protein [Dehalococcoidia bacterium]|nr:HIT domain-containing protein [Dehalococcoidia bacterium]